MFVQDMKRRKGKGICVFGGGELARSLFAADLIDELVLNIHPILLGSGIPPFHEIDRQVELELLQCQAQNKGNLIVSYRVKHS